MTTTQSVSIPGLIDIKATEVKAPPAWAVMERQLITLMEESAHIVVRKYAERGGTWLWSDDLDDYYERSHNWCLLYAMGADESLVDMALEKWNATTRLFDDRAKNRANSLDYYHGTTPNKLKHNIHNEYYSLANPGDAEWHHMGEGNMAFYDFGVADPTISENVRRARRFAAMFIGEDPEAPNWDPKHKLIRSPMNSSQGPWHDAELHEVMSYLQGGQASAPGWTPKPMGPRASLYPVVKELEPNWWEDPKRADEIVRLFDKVVLNGDSAANLAATGLVTNAYLYTGEEKYKRWVLEYVEAWMDRIRQNNGIVPDNIGPTGKPGENRDGVWWGGVYGWNTGYGYSHIFHSLAVASECALLLTGDFGYLELLRSQIKMLLDNSFTREDGHLLAPVRVTPEGWDKATFAPLRIYEPVHLYHASMSKEDYEIIARLREGDRERDWNEEQLDPPRAAWNSEYSRFQYYDGKNPNWPEKILRAEYQRVLDTHHRIEADTSDVWQVIADNQEPVNPVFTNVLTQVMLGSPRSMYHGGLLRATVRYYDSDRVRPGLPLDVAALVDRLAPDGVGIQLVNLSRRETRNLIVQAGAFGEHQFTDLRFQEEHPADTGESAGQWLRRQEWPRTRTDRVVPLDSKYFAVELPPSTSIRVEAGMKRFVNDPSYAFPWHGDKIPAPFQ